MLTKKQAAVAWIVGLVLIAAGVAPAGAAIPDQINYQGVLRDAAGQPLSGNFDMAFLFWNASASGDLIMMDKHLSANFIPVTVTNGLFNVALGSGRITDGTGPGTYASLADVFRDYSIVFLEVSVGGETLSPRTRILSAAYALNAENLDGMDSSSFLDTSATTQTKLGGLVVNGSGTDVGIQAAGSIAGVIGLTQTASAIGYLAVEGGLGIGVQGIGGTAGGAFSNGLSNAQAYVAGGSGINPNWGIEASGSYDPAAGTGGGGYFTDSAYSGYAKVGHENYGIQGFGSTSGGYFNRPGGAGVANVGTFGYGIDAHGSYDFGGAGGYFQDDTYGASARVGYGGTGIYAAGPDIGGTFIDTNSGAYGNVGYSTYKIQGSGLVSFVQNHPNDAGKVVVYGAPEGPEAATYTRGTAKIANGEARIALDPTFALVTNPDIGLTAHVTPRGRSAVVYAESVTSSELIVKSDDPKSDGAVIDYLVYGLRIGFEEVAIIQPKQRESLIPSMATHRALLTKQPELAQYTALSRFQAMRTRQGETPALNLSASQALHDAIGEFDPAIHASIMAPPSNPNAKKPEDVPVTTSGRVPSGPMSAPMPGVLPQRPVAPSSVEGDSAPPRRSRDELENTVPVSEQVEAGQVLVSAADGSGLNHLGDVASDRGVVGIVAGEPGQLYSGSAPLAPVGTLVTCRVDATFAPIARGDLLAASPTMGHAMKSPDGAPGTIVGKALESLESGTGTIKVLVMPR